MQNHVLLRIAVFGRVYLPSHDGRAIANVDAHRTAVEQVEKAGTEARASSGEAKQPNPPALVGEDTIRSLDIDHGPLGIVIRMEQIEVAVVVEIFGVRSHTGLTESAVAQRAAALVGAILKGPIAPVHPQLVGPAVVGDENVHQTVVVEVAQMMPMPAPNALSIPAA